MCTLMPTHRYELYTHTHTVYTHIYTNTLDILEVCLAKLALNAEIALL